jgi:hypothetical protein
MSRRMRTVAVAVFAAGSSMPPMRLTQIHEAAIRGVKCGNVYGNGPYPTFSRERERENDQANNRAGSTFFGHSE